MLVGIFPRTVAVETPCIASLHVREFDPQGQTKYAANIQGLSKGVYLVDIWNKQARKSVVKLIVE